MNVDDDIDKIRERRADTPDSEAGRYLQARGMDAEAVGKVQALEIAVRSLTAALDGELDGRNDDWMPYLEDKAEQAAYAARRLAEAAATARELPA